MRRTQGARAFSLLVLTERPHGTRLLPKKSRTSLPCPVQSSSENALVTDQNRGPLIDTQGPSHGLLEGLPAVVTSTLTYLGGRIDQGYGLLLLSAACRTSR